MDYTWRCEDTGTPAVCAATRYYRVNASAGAHGGIAPEEQLVTYNSIFEFLRFDFIDRSALRAAGADLRRTIAQRGCGFLSAQVTTRASAFKHSVFRVVDGC